MNDIKPFRLDRTRSSAFRHRITSFIVVSLMAASGPAAIAQDYPARPVRLVVPLGNSPGQAVHSGYEPIHRSAQRGLNLANFRSSKKEVVAWGPIEKTAASLASIGSQAFLKTWGTSRGTTS